MKLYLITLIILIAWILLVLLRIEARQEVDEQTKALCRHYALQDHSGEIGKERLEKMGYLWTNFDYYNSCLLQTGGAIK